jgi:hypothetical protein
LLLVAETKTTVFVEEEEENLRKWEQKKID